MGICMYRRVGMEYGRGRFYSSANFKWYAAAEISLSPAWGKGGLDMAAWMEWVMGRVVSILILDHCTILRCRQIIQLSST